MKQTKILISFIIIATLLFMTSCHETTSNYESVAIPTPEQSKTSDWHAVEEFLSVYLSAFSIGFASYDGTYRDFSLNELPARPLVIWQRIEEYPWSNIYYDRLGNRIEDAPFLHNGGFFADFTLYDLDDGGMPTIIMRWVLPETCATFREVWRFIDGEYRNVGELMTWPNLFHDPEGNLIVLYDDVMRDEMAYYFLTFTDYELEHESIVDAANLDWDDWANHHWGDEFIIAPTIIGTDIALIPVQRLTELENKIVEAVRLMHDV